jgi:hypothetical protein
MSTISDSEAAPHAIYSGRDRLGSLVQRGKEFVACDRQGKSLRGGECCGPQGCHGGRKLWRAP